MLAAKIREEIRTSEETGLFRYHFGLGMWMRNNWSLWVEESRIKLFFDSLGVNDADDISSLIITSYWNYLNGRPIELPKRIVYSKIERNAINGEANKGIFPDCSN
jgi:hypothetical protein